MFGFLERAGHCGSRGGPNAVRTAGGQDGYRTRSRHALVSCERAGVKAAPSVQAIGVRTLQDLPCCGDRGAVRGVWEQLFAEATMDSSRPSGVCAAMLSEPEFVLVLYAGTSISLLAIWLLSTVLRFVVRRFVSAALTIVRQRVFGRHRRRGRRMALSGNGASGHVGAPGQYRVPSTFGGDDGLRLGIGGCVMPTEYAEFDPLSDPTLPPHLEPLSDDYVGYAAKLTQTYGASCSTELTGSFGHGCTQLVNSLPFDLNGGGGLPFQIADAGIGCGEGAGGSSVRWGESPSFQCSRTFLLPHAVVSGQTTSFGRVDSGLQHKAHAGGVPREVGPGMAVGVVLHDPRALSDSTGTSNRPAFECGVLDMNADAVDLGADLPSQESGTCDPSMLWTATPSGTPARAPPCTTPPSGEATPPIRNLAVDSGVNTDRWSARKRAATAPRGRGNGSSSGRGGRTPYRATNPKRRAAASFSALMAKAASADDGNAGATAVSGAVGGRGNDITSNVGDAGAPGEGGKAEGSTTGVAAKGDKGDGGKWSEEDSICLVLVKGEYDVEMERTAIGIGAKAKSSDAKWAEVVERLQAKGVQKELTDVKRKWENLKFAYNRVVFHNRFVSGSKNFFEMTTERRERRRK
ncbi:hypothetical protein CBR_g37668 [Chara braunii]|uniref:Myb/SANT-like DNA-binding domain-containing protein n=1 Tax=Chara braunii TaxID=69332 RepID=A0A388LNE6_CHABU|nr:hypothetical protein CBR_g37668 [Chara braunii]|eukprot:GBG83870.1 hypothetical protein CBR_g37668 [Chara braunii]